MSSRLQINSISFSYNLTPILTDITFDLNPGQFLGIIGPNGAGKSTLLRLCGGILNPEKGSIKLDAVDLHQISTRERARIIAFVPQETYFALNFTVEEIILMGRYPYSRPFRAETKKDHEIMEKAMELADLTSLRKRPINTLSSGEKQRAVIARALCQGPEILLLDEPTSHLDLQHTQGIMDLLTRLNQDGISIIAVNHDLNLASLYCRELILLHKGMIHASGPPQTLINQTTIDQVYQTSVTVVKHPVNGQPQIFKIGRAHV